MRIILLVSSFSMFIAGCGSDEKSGGNASIAPPKQNQALYIAEGSDLPVCGADNEQQLVYSATDTKFKACQSGAWVDVVVKGEKGDKGDRGSKGDKGDVGDDGKSNQITKSHHCEEVLETPTAKYSLDVHYTLHGDVFVSAIVSHNTTGASRSIFIPKADVSADAIHIDIFYDVTGVSAATGRWRLSYRPFHGVVDVNYYDADISGGQKYWLSIKCETANHT